LNKIELEAFNDIKKLIKKKPIKFDGTENQLDEIIKNVLLEQVPATWSKNESKLFYKSLINILKKLRNK
jgi:hypothetical protein